jgi:ABC-type multidrug transport system fused ATPase/permease subunit
VEHPEITSQRQAALVADLKALAAQRMAALNDAGKQEASRAIEARREHQRVHREATAKFEVAHARLIAEYHQRREAVLTRYESEACALNLDEQRDMQADDAHFRELREAARTLRQHLVTQIQRAFREEKQRPKTDLIQFQKHCDESAQELSALVVRAQQVARRRAPWPDDPPPAEPQAGLSRQEYVERFAAAMSAVYARLQELTGVKSARFLNEGWPVLIFLSLLVAVGAPGLRLSSTIGLGWVVAGSVAIALVVTAIIYAIILPLARRSTLRRVPPFQQAVAEARAYLAASLAASQKEAARQRRHLMQRATKDLAAAKADYRQSRRDLRTQHAASRRKIAVKFAARRRGIEAQHERELDEIEDTLPRQIEALEQAFARQVEQLDDALRQNIAAVRQEIGCQRSAAVARWQAGLGQFRDAVAAMNAYCDDVSSPWDQVADELASTGARPAEDVAALRIGRLALDLHSLSAGKDVAAAGSAVTVELPAVLSYPECPSLLLEAADDGRDAATRVLQSVMLRLATTFPPGKVRFTIIDPVGLGENFSAFMHLADYDERLVASRIWTEATHIQQRLTDLTEHMENVIQKYLRNEFESIQDYNRQAGEVAEPFQILVIANFPANFSDEAARRLVSIATSGARCGVYTLISTDTRLERPRNFNLADLEAQALTLVWHAADKRFRYKTEELAALPLVLEQPPSDEQFTSIVRSVGLLAKDAARVEVPFDFVVPPAGTWWTADSRGGIEAPLGRAGAKALQALRLGRGTSQHVLVAGKTGSGKSTLLNATITNLALHYSPDELEFYLIDFKKGVEFKAYATHRLPHARVIAIESEREFGLSVLERLDQELKRRGDLFRQQGVQDIKGFRNAAAAGVAMPRILLVIDEFQEFFTSDDRISHDASLLLDRLVRQGRAFGIHVLLGSQTLAGAYSLARSTIGQMAVRIALQCSESDAHLILSEDNTAARLLSRPGEAIYNDANGLLEGNHPFQVVWLSDEQRESYLDRIAVLADERRPDRPAPIVFEGNAPADPRDNRQLAAVFQSPPPAKTPLAPVAWLGAAVAVKEPTPIPFRRQSGSNLLIVGQQEELALGMLATAALALAGQCGRLAPRDEIPLAERADHEITDRRIIVLDGTRPDSPEAGYWTRLVGEQNLDARIVLPRDAAAAITGIAQEVERRLAAAEHAAEPIFVFIHNLARFRDLKKSDDYGFDDEGAGVGKQLATILREGPPLGVHALVWCDSYNNVNRWLDRQALRDFELRVLFQMSATDSSNLMDSPAASRLGPHMSLFYSEEQGQAEKLRPYGLPPAEWLAWVKGQQSGVGSQGSGVRGQESDS